MRFPGFSRPGAAPASSSRRSFLRTSTSLAVAAGAAGFSTVARGGIEPDADTALPNNTVGFFNQIQAHENAHVAALVTALGANARPKPTFQHLGQRKARYFTFVAQALENTGVGAYPGAAPYINSRQILATAGSIALVEGRHAGWLNTLVADPITGNALDETSDNNFDTPLTADQVATLAGSFIASLNGGPPLTYSTTPSDANDIDILNFALALEYLEADFYNINVPVFFPAP